MAEADPLPSVRPFLKGVFILLFLVLGVAGRADDFALANDLFDQGKFADAKQHYEKLIASGAGNANVYYNLGNTDYRLGFTGPAILDYERALALDPRHLEARMNIKLLREQSAAKLPQESWFSAFYAGLPLDTWVLAATAAGWVTIFCVLSLAVSRRPEKGGAWFLTVVAIIASAVAGVGVWLGLQDQTLGVITAKQAACRLAPAEGAGIADTLPAGSRVHVLSERGAWTYCELPNAGRGWIPHGMVERVRTLPAS